MDPGRTWIVGGLVVGMVCGATAVRAAQGTGSLYVSGATHTPTHWNIPVESPTTAEIHGVSTSEVGDPLPATLDVFVKSSVFGNTQLVATRIGTSSDYTFTYTPPTVAGGQSVDACGTTVVAYRSLGLNSNNDLLDDGLQNSSRAAACGFRFLFAGIPLECFV